MTEERSVPFDGDSEEAVIGSLLLDSESISRIIRIIQPGDFFREKNGWIFEACLGLYNKGVGIDVKTVGAELKAAGKLEGVGGPSYLIHCLDAVPTSTHVAHYAQIVAKHAQSRKLISLAGDIARMGYDGEEGAVATAIDKLVRLSGKRGLLSPKEWGDGLLTQIGRRVAGELRSVPFPWAGVSDMTGGMAPGDVFIVGARPGMGKTTFLQQAAHSVAGPVLFVSAEMDESGLGDRYIAQRANIPIRLLHRGEWDDAGYGRIQEAIGELAEGEVWPFAGRGMTTAEIRAVAGEIQVRTGSLSLIVVDYLQILGDREGESQNVRIGNISRNLKSLAAELHVPVLAASQLNRALDTRMEKRPVLADLRDSGSIEQDADVVLFLHRDDYYNRHNNPGVIEIIQAKHRQYGNTETVRLHWNAQSHSYGE